MSKAAFDLVIIPSAKVGRRKGQLIPAGEPVRRNRVLADRRVTYSLQLLTTGKNKVYCRRIIFTVQNYCNVFLSSWTREILKSGKAIKTFHLRSLAENEWQLFYQLQQ